MVVVRPDAQALGSLIDTDAELSKVASGFGFTEGATWSVQEQRLYFSDIPGDTRYRFSDESGLETVLTPTYKGNGNSFDLDGNLICCEHVSSSVTRYNADGRREVLSFHFEGRYLNSPNDLVTFSRDGSIYFTDPEYGRWSDWVGSKRAPDLDFRGIFRIPPGGGPTELVVEPGEFDQPNGMCFSPDESLLYINDTSRCEIKSFEIDQSGRLTSGRVVISGVEDPTMPNSVLDGMECDEHGNIWVTGPGGVWIISPEGERLGIIDVPEVCGSVSFGGHDLRTLYICGSTSLYSIPTLCAAAPLPHHRLRRLADQ